MIRSTAVLVVMLSVGAVSRVYAQETAPGPGTVEITPIPGGAVYFTGGNDTSSFGTYTLGGALAYNVNRIGGLRGDYRFMATRSKDDGPAFFGQDARYGHRVYGAVIINAIR